MVRPKVSICIPVYNVEHLISRCLDSLVNQTLVEIEIIIVDDCSPDNSMSVVSEYAQRDNRITVLTHEKNRGLMAARRTGYMAAKGDYIMFCDSDDSMVGNAAEIMYNASVESDADIVSCNVTYIEASGKETIIQSSIRYGNDKISVFKSLLLDDLSHNLWGKLYKRELLQNYSYITYENFTNGEDACLFYQVVNNCNKMVHLDKAVYRYYQNSTSSTNIKLKEQALKNIILTNKIINDVCIQYKDLQILCKRRLFRSLSFFSGIGYSNEIRTLAKQYNLSFYTKVTNALPYMSIFEFGRFICRYYYWRFKYCK